MSSEQKQPQYDLKMDNSVSSLETHLKDLIISNSYHTASPAGDGSQASPSPQRRSVQNNFRGSTTHSHSLNAASPEATRREGSPSISNQPSSHSSKQAKRRPNQAQRRQMNSQFIFTQEPPVQNTQASAPRGASSYQPYQRHAVSNSQPQTRQIPRQSDHPRSYGSWSGPSRDHAGEHASALATHPISPVGYSSHQNNNSPYSNPHNPRRTFFRPEEITSQANWLQILCYHTLPNSEIDGKEIAEKEAFRRRVEAITRDVLHRYEQQQQQQQNNISKFPPFSVELKCFGSLSSGFATKSSDMDLGLLSPYSTVQPDSPGSPIPRLLEKALLEAGLGARLLSRTRVPIIKLCELPPEQLRRNLLEEREKWENESENGNHTAVDDNQGHHSPLHQGAELTYEAEQNNESMVNLDDMNNLKTEGDAHYLHLQQGSQHSLASYYGLAKRILRRIGGCDATAANVQEFGDEDWKTLNNVCQAFVQGLSDFKLKERLSRYPSTSWDSSIDNTRCNQSLSALYLQIEGEKILNDLQSWSTEDFVLVHSTQDEQTLQHWKALLMRDLKEIEPVSYTKDLQLTLERLKKIPSIQLVTLEQHPEETPSQYCARAQLVLQILKGYQAVPNSLERSVTERYVAGIHNKKDREAIQTYLEQFPDQSTLQAIGCRHKSIALASELECRIEKGTHGPLQVTDIATYIDLLRAPLQSISKASEQRKFVVLIPPEHIDILSKMKALDGLQQTITTQSRDRFRDMLEFPKTGAGVQCDINFSAHLALQNTLLLRCYSHTDPRVRPMVLFVKNWAKVRGINSGYRGTLSSYGYVLMVLHYLVNIVQPFVCPNLQHLAPRPPSRLSPAQIEATVSCRGCNIQFWRNESEIMQLAATNQLNHNNDSIGFLLRGFFEYYAQNGLMTNSSVKGFDWGRDVISLRTPGGLMSKQEKGWTGAKTVYEVQKPITPTYQRSNSNSGVPATPEPKATQVAHKNEEVKEVRLRYLFAIEDPFELDHNVARTVTHNGIVGIRDEFRRAWRIIKAAGNGSVTENLLQDKHESNENSAAFLRLFEDIHGLKMH